jgi:hypothetical protein
LRERVRAIVQARRLVQEQKLLLQRCDCSGAFAAHHAAWFRAHGVPACRYVRTPVPDPCADGRLTAATRARTDKPVVLLLGHLAGTATLAGIDLFMTETLPVMEREFGRDGFEVRIVGGMLDKVPPRLLERMRHPAVQLAGQINPPDGPFAESHFLVVPTPVELGIRVRILTGFSYGACVLAHRANRCGIPELEDGVNCALGDDGAQLGEHMVWFWRHPADRARLATGGRRTYETYFAPAGAGRELADLILKGRAAG